MNNQNGVSDKGEIMLLAIGGIDESLLSEAAGVSRKRKYIRMASLVATLLIVTLCLIPVISGIGGTIQKTIGSKGDANTPSLEDSGDSFNGSDPEDDGGYGYFSSVPLVIKESDGQSDDDTDALIIARGSSAFYVTDGDTLYVLTECDISISGAEYTASQRQDGTLYEIVANSDFSIIKGEYTLSFYKQAGGYHIEIS